jgi:hypothetical protein
MDLSNRIIDLPFGYWSYGAERIAKIGRKARGEGGDSRRVADPDGSETYFPSGFKIFTSSA